MNIIDILCLAFMLCVLVFAIFVGFVTYFDWEIEKKIKTPPVYPDFVSPPINWRRINFLAVFKVQVDII